MKNLTAFIAGLVFGLGLLLSGMANPEKVIGFLDIAGLWDPSLIFVIVGAIGVATVGFALARRQSTATSSAKSQARIDYRLIAGALLFGIGWGLTGICPGPAMVLLGTGMPQGIVFMVGLLGGMLLYRYARRFKP